MFSVVLNDAYFQIPIHPELRPFLQFMVNKWIHQFTGLHFSLSSVPQVFTSVLCSHEAGTSEKHLSSAKFG